jgi:iron complex outermembrane receptor protein
MEVLNDKLNITPGIQLNNYSDYGLNMLPGVDMGYILSDRITVYGSIGYTYRVPTFTDIYYTGPVNIGNPDLKPEYAMNYEIGLKTRSNLPVSTQSSIFYRAGKDMIDWQRFSDGEPWQPVNLLFVEMLGLDFSSIVNFSQILSKDNILQQLQLNYTYIESKAENQNNTLSRYALENLRHQFRGTIWLKYGHNITHTISLGYYDRVNLDDYSLLDSRLNYKSDRFTFFADITNILNVTYQETNLVTMPGRWFKMGVNVKVL